MRPKLYIEVLQILKLQDLGNQQKVIQILTTHSSASTYGVQNPQYSKFMWGQD
jgi:hypothetical protein